MKQTAVEWLVEELRKHEFLGTFCTPEELENKKNGSSTYSYSNPRNI